MALSGAGRLQGTPRQRAVTGFFVSAQRQQSVARYDAVPYLPTGSFHMRSFTRILSSCLLLGSMLGQATAADIADIFRSQDTDHDGALSVEEARAAAPAAFRAIDRDGNGIVDADEISANIVAEAGPGIVIPAVTLTAVTKGTLEQWDGNHDGKVTEQEYSNAAVAMLLLADSDGDRRVTREELRRFRGEPVTP
ncbi:hypothetical protein IPC1432_21850 [Pseudomonas aeruginosa]|nr:hypothetical protein IPC1432_21850 [Pseudomonas aeruginosa]